MAPVSPSTIRNWLTAPRRRPSSQRSVNIRHGGPGGCTARSAWRVPRGRRRECRPPWRRRFDVPSTNRPTARAHAVRRAQPITRSARAAASMRVRHQQAGGAVRAHLVAGPSRARRCRVEVAGRLVGQQQRGRCTSARDRHPLQLAARKRLRQPRAEAARGRRRRAWPATAASSGAAAAAAAARRSAPRLGAAARGRPGTRSRARAGSKGAAARRSARVMGGPSSCTRRHRACRAPAMPLSSVDLPTPDSPTMATNSPARSSRSTPLNTGVLP